eukprot:Gb_13883 [translate_table: standard]
MAIASIVTQISPTGFRKWSQFFHFICCTAIAGPKDLVSDSNMGSPKFSFPLVLKVSGRISIDFGVSPEPYGVFARFLFENLAALGPLRLPVMFAGMFASEWADVGCRSGFAFILPREVLAKTKTTGWLMRVMRPFNWEYIEILQRFGDSLFEAFPFSIHNLLEVGKPYGLAAGAVGYLVVYPDQMSYEELTALGEAIGTVKTGVPPTVLAAGPGSSYYKQNSGEGEPGPCTICCLSNLLQEGVIEVFEEISEPVKAVSSIERFACRESIAKEAHSTRYLLTLFYDLDFYNFF